MGGACGARRAWGSLCSPPPRPHLLGEEGQRLPQTTQVQLCEAEGQRCIDPGVKYKVAEWGKKNLKINPKDLCRKTPRKHREARWESTEKTSPSQSLKPESALHCALFSPPKPTACQALQGSPACLCWNPQDSNGLWLGDTDDCIRSRLDGV